MIVSDIFPELQEVVGSESEAVCFNALTRGIELLANKGLYDPLVATVDISVQAGYKIALPWDVKSPIRINIGGSPSFARSRLFEFSANTDGSVDGQENGLQWSDAGYSPIQNETGLPGPLYYISNSTDARKSTITVYGRDIDGREISETLNADVVPQLGLLTFYEITYVRRDITTGECQLFCRGETDNTIARYYGQETDPRYRVVKLSQTATVVRVFYRKNVFRINYQTDIINLHSGLAVILAAKAARYYLQENWGAAAGALAEATNIINEEQASRHELEVITPDVLTATNLNINTIDSVIVADIYDDAAAAFGPIGRNQIFDELTTCLEVLSNKAHWDAQLGYVDIYRSENNEVNVAGNPGNGYFVLPRYVDAIMAVNWNGKPQMPRNRWFEFHLNGTGERNISGKMKWDDLDEVVIVNQFPRDPTTKLIIPQQIVAIPDSPLDNDTLITVYGYDDNDRQVTVTVPCVQGSLVPATQLLTRIDRIVKDTSVGSIQLVCVNPDATAGLLLGYWYPDEVEPKYRAIKLQSIMAARIRVAYRKRSVKIGSLFDPIHLRSRLAIRTMIASLVLRKTDPAGAAQLEDVAVNYLREEQAATHPNKTVGLQFHEETSPFLNWNVQ